MSMRRSTGRDRRGVSQRNPLGPSVDMSSFYASGINIDVDARLNVTQSGNRISQILDRVSGQAFVQGTGANQPLWVLGVTPLGQPAIHLDSAARNLRLTGLATMTTASMTIYAVQRTSTTDGLGFGRCNVAGSTGFIYNSSAGNRSETALGGGVISDGAYPSNTFEVISLRITASGGFATACTTKEMYVNGSLKTTSGTPTFANPGAASIATIGWTATTGNHQYARILLAENVLHDATTHSNIVNALRSGYGI